MLGYLDAIIHACYPFVLKQVAYRFANPLYSSRSSKRESRRP